MAFLGIQGVWMTYFYLPPEDSGNKPIVDTALFAMVTFIVRLLAGFLSPFVGHLSDNTSTRIGKRIPYILVGVPLFAIFKVFFGGFHSKEKVLVHQFILQLYIQCLNLDSSFTYFLILH